jgi:hypothetical protein
MKRGRPSGNIEMNYVDQKKATEEIVERFGKADESSVILQYIKNKTKELENEEDNTKKFKIERGNWVTPDKNYAKMHGLGALNGKYKIISKTVRAKDLYTDGNSLSEWGYDPR